MHTKLTANGMHVSSSLLKLSKRPLRAKTTIKNMKTQEIPEWEGLTDYRPPIFEEYEFDFSLEKNGDNHVSPELDKDRAIYLAGLNYARDIVKDPCNSKWIERRKLTDAFEMGIEYAKRFNL